MAEPTLTLTRTNLYDAVGQYLGVSRTSGDWSSETSSDIAFIVESGQRNFFVPVLVSKNPNAPTKSHVWSFLINRLTVTLTNNTATYDLPEDFSGLMDIDYDGNGVMAFSSAKDWPLLVVPMWRVLEKIQAGTSMPTGITQPLLAAVEPKTFTASTGQRWQLVVWPTPTTASGLNNITARYRVNPDKISSGSYYPLGGSQFAECLLESCLASAEEFLNDQSYIHRDRFQEMLAACVKLDMQLHQPEVVPTSQ